MTDLSSNLSDFKLALKRKGLHYKLKSQSLDGDFGESLCLIDALSGTQVTGKIVRSFTEGEVYHWPLLCHENLAPLFDVVNVSAKLSIFITINREITLKNIIHDEDFVYEPRCFERKKSYAKGIFSGLSYLHGKSLCLMNLSDNNVIICKFTDKAIISNFSCLVCSRRTVRSKLAVPELYKAPESEKGEFDATAAEIWAAGTLMLDMFLAHMVPWAIVDYKPSRIMEMIDAFSFELLEAANAGSVLSFLDLIKFKTFLKCFFKPKPVVRISAKNAAIASFLSPNSYKHTTRVDNGTSRYSNTEFASRQIKRQQFALSVNQQPPKVFPNNSGEKQAFSENYPNNERNLSKPQDSKLERKNSYVCINRETSFAANNLSSSSIPMTSKSVKENKCQDTLGTSKRSSTIQSKFLEWKQDDSQLIKSQFIVPKQELPESLNKQECIHAHDTFTSPHCNRYSPCRCSGEISISTNSNFPESGGCFQTTKKNASVEQHYYSRYQSKSLTFLKPEVADNGDNIAPCNFRFCRSCSNSNIKSLSVRQLNTNQEQKSEFCLDWLFKDEDKTGEIGGSRKSTDAVKSVSESPCKKELVDKCQIQENISKNYVLENHFNENCTMKSEFYALQTSITPDILDIVTSIILIKQCQLSIFRHPKINTSEKFVGRQSELLKQYQFLLHQEEMRLYTILKRNHALNGEDIVKLIKVMNAKPMQKLNAGTQCRISTPNQTNFSVPHRYSRFCESKFLVRKPPRQNYGKQSNNLTKQCVNQVKSANVTTNVRPQRQHSYSTAIEISAMNKKKEFEVLRKKVKPANPVFSIENGSKDKLIGENSKMNTDEKITKIKPKIKKKESESKNQCRKQVTTTEKEKCSKILAKGKEMQENDAKVAEIRRKQRKVVETRRFFFFSLCPGGRIEEPSALEDLCETCQYRLENI